jgi:hypothetical protein
VKVYGRRHEIVDICIGGKYCIQLGTWVCSVKNKLFVMKYIKSIILLDMCCSKINVVANQLAITLIVCSYPFKVVINLLYIGMNT